MGIISVSDELSLISFSLVSQENIADVIRDNAAIPVIILLMLFIFILLYNDVLCSINVTAFLLI